MARKKPPILLLSAFVLALGFSVDLLPLHAQQVHRDSFEGRETGWTRDRADAPFRELTHDLTDNTAHTGHHSEHILLQAEMGSYIYYFYPSGHGPLNDELTVSLWLKANRPGAQVLARLVLPKERNPKNPDDRLSILLRGDLYQNVGRWQRLEVRRPVKLAKDQQQLLRAEFNRDVDITDAYIDRLILNVHSGPGKTEIWIDDVEIGPVLDSSPFQMTSRTTIPGVKTPLAPAPKLPGRASIADLKQDHLSVNGKPFFMRGIRHSDTPLSVLRDTGLNTIWFDSSTPSALLEEAVNLGFWIVPSLPVTSDDPRWASPDTIKNEVSRLSSGDAVLFWDMGGGVVEEQKDTLSKAGEWIHAIDPQRPLGADIWDGFRPYSRNLDMVGVHRWPLMTTLELTQYREWLDQRRRLMRDGVYFWTWVQTHLPDWYTQLIYNQPAANGFAEPIGPQSEQIRLLTYLALASGCKGLGFWSDRFLADSHQGRDRLLTLALLNLEIQMLEPILSSATSADWVDTSDAEIKAAVLRTDYGTLVLPMWLGKGAQFVPGQLASAKVTIKVPNVPPGTQPWQLTPATIHTLQSKRVVGGTEITINEFGVTAAILFTAETNPTGMIVRLQEKLPWMRKLAAQWAYKLAEVELEKVTRVESQLEADGHTLPDGQSLMNDARKRLKVCVENWNNGDYRQAYEEAERVLRPLRILMRAQWEQAIRGLDTPVASPYAVSFFTLPRHWRFLAQIRQAGPYSNLLPDGDFEGDGADPNRTWRIQETKLDPVDMSAARVREDPKEGRQCLKLEIKPQNPAFPIFALERTYLAMKSPTIRLTPGSLVRVSGWVRIPKAITASVDGALLFDSAGGEPLGIRLTEAVGWKKFTFYRQVPASGEMYVTVAMTGLGKVYFDDIRVEPLAATNPAANQPLSH